MNWHSSLPGDAGAEKVKVPPFLNEIGTTLDRGISKPISGQNSVRGDHQGVRVIIKENNPLRSMGYYLGR